jgi:hypothetical protein
MRFFEFAIKPIKPLTPQKAQINALKQQKERATTALKNERVRQQKQKAVAAIQRNNQTLAKLNSSS